MANRQLGFVKGSVCNLKEQLFRKTLRNVRSQGHAYVDLRQEGKSFLYFCVLCQSKCYSDTVLFQHLKGSLHAEMAAVAKATLLIPNPWPFSDGVLFFYDSDGDRHSDNVNDGQRELLDTCLDDERSLAIVEYDNKLTPKGDEHFVHDEYCPVDCHLTGEENGGNFVIPGVLIKDDVSNLEVKHIGIGEIAVRLTENDDATNRIHRIWCQWVGKDSDDNDVPEHEFAVVTFSYTYNLSRNALLDNVRYLLPSSPNSESEETSGARNKKRKSFSDPEDMSESLSNQCDSSGEESHSPNNSNMRLALGACDDQLLISRIIKSKTVRRELRKQKLLASERMCGICQRKMFPGKDVAALLNRKTGRLVCSSRNTTGAFHVFHISCLIHWILLCEFETYGKPFDESKVEVKGKQRTRRKAGTKYGGKRKNAETKAVKKQLSSVFCPECQGTGISVNVDDLEKPPISLSEMHKYKLKVSDARKAWTKSPEVLDNCSIGFHFPHEHDDLSQEHVSPLKLLHFFRANESS